MLEVSHAAQQVVEECESNADASASMIEDSSPDCCPAAMAAPQVRGHAGQAPARGAAGHAGPDRGALRARRAAAHAGAAARARQLHTLRALRSAVPGTLPASEKDVSLATTSARPACKECLLLESSVCVVVSVQGGQYFQGCGPVQRTRAQGVRVTSQRLAARVKTCFYFILRTACLSSVSRALYWQHGTQQQASHLYALLQTSILRRPALLLRAEALQIGQDCVNVVERYRLVVDCQCCAACLLTAVLRA